MSDNSVEVPAFGDLSFDTTLLLIHFKNFVVLCTYIEWTYLCADPVLLVIKAAFLGRAVESKEGTRHVTLGEAISFLPLALIRVRAFARNSFKFLRRCGERDERVGTVLLYNGRTDNMWEVSGDKINIIPTSSQ